MNAIPSATDADTLIRLATAAVTKHYGTTDTELRAKINPMANNHLLTQWGRTYSKALEHLRANPSRVQKVVDAEEYAELEWPTPEEHEQQLTSAIYEGIGHTIGNIAARVLREMPELRELQSDLASINSTLQPVFDRINTYDQLDAAIASTTAATEQVIEDSRLNSQAVLDEFDQNTAMRQLEFEEAFSPEAMEAETDRRNAEAAQRAAEQADTARIQADQATRAARATATRQARAEEEARNLEARRQAEEKDRQFSDAMSVASDAHEANLRQLEIMQNEEMNNQSADAAIRALEDRLRAAEEARIEMEAHSLEVLEAFNPGQSWSGGCGDLMQASQAQRTQPKGTRR